MQHLYFHKRRRQEQDAMRQPDARALSGAGFERRSFRWTGNVVWKLAYPSNRTLKLQRNVITASEA